MGGRGMKGGEGRNGEWQVTATDRVSCTEIKVQKRLKHDEVEGVGGKVGGDVQEE